MDQFELSRQSLRDISTPSSASVQDETYPSGWWLIPSSILGACAWVYLLDGIF